MRRPDTGAPVPFEAASHIEAALMEQHLASMRNLSEQAQIFFSYSAGRRVQVLSTPPSKVSLSVCGTVIVPFGGTLLLALEHHLRSFVVKSAGETTGKGEGGIMTHGWEHLVAGYRPSNTTALSRLGVSEDVVLRWERRQRHDGDAARCDNLPGAPPSCPTSQRCFAYRVAMWNAYMEWVLGELDIFPKVLVTWISWDHLLLNTIVDRMQTLSDLLRLQTPPRGLVRVVDQLIERFEWLSVGSGVAVMDTKPKDFLVRQVSRRTVSGAIEHIWEGRLSDIRTRGMHNPVAGVIPGLHPHCYLVLNLQLPTIIFACGPLRQSEFARRFVRRALNGSMANSAEWFSSHCASPFGPGHLSQGQLARDRNDGGMATGRITYEDVMELYKFGNAIDGRPVSEGFTRHAHAAIYAAWARNGSTKCPSDKLWHVDGVLPRLMESEEIPRGGGYSV
jgi:hypothetical protein